MAEWKISNNSSAHTHTYTILQYTPSYGGLNQELFPLFKNAIIHFGKCTLVPKENVVLNATIEDMFCIK